MSFEKFGVVNYIEESKASEFIDFLESGKVFGTKCKGCGKIYFPPKKDCPRCLKSDCEWHEVPRKGKLMTFSKVNYGPLGFEDKAPYILGVAQFDKGIHVMTIFSDEIAEKNIQIGMNVEVRPMSEGEKVYYVFTEPQIY